VGFFSMDASLKSVAHGNKALPASAQARLHPTGLRPTYTRMFARTPVFEAYIAPAARYPAIWRLVLGTITGFLVYMGGAAAILWFGLGPAAALFPELAGMDAYGLLYGNGSTPGQMFLILATFIAMGLAAITMCFWHWRGLASLLGRRAGFSRMFFIAIGVLLAVQLVYAVISAVVAPLDTTPHLPLATWASHLVWAIPLLLIQTTSEELVFRGYFQQQIAARFDHWVLWMVLPSLVFGLGHFNAEIDPVLAWMIVGATTLFGVIAADLTRLTGSLAAAMGLHFANNFLALLVMGIPGELSGLALYHAPFTMDDTAILQTYLMIDMALLVGIWAILRRVLR